MNRVLRVTVMFAVLLAISAGTVFAQGARGMIERKAWYVDGDRKVGEMLYWRIFLGDYNVKLRRSFPGEGEITVDAGMNFQFFSAGYIEGNGTGSKGRVSALMGMRIRIDGQVSEIKIEEIDYIYDYGTKVAMKDGRKGEFVMQMQPENTILELKRFQLSEYKQVKGQWGELELKEVRDRMPIIGISFTKEGAARAAHEAVSE
ncbi:MAG: hypothetical protein FWC23_10055 [Chitinispirillia bacterium]|nr:hypothetical protein [Chitinispirillia bacterium]MCL2269511.1 hypothetical protein [Chitinispirillia bacterium]